MPQDTLDVVNGRIVYLSVYYNMLVISSLYYNMNTLCAVTSNFCMKTKFVLGLAMVGMALATAHSAKAAFSVDISIGSRFPRSAPVVVAPPPIVYSPTPVDNCAQPFVGYAAPVMVAPPPQVIVTRPGYRYYDHRYAYRHDDWRNHHAVYARDDLYGRHGRW